MAASGAKVTAVHLPRLLKFAGVGVVNTVAGLSLIYACMYLWGIGPYASNAIGYGVGFVLGYALNRNWTFQYKGGGGHTIFAYAAVMCFSYVVNVGAVYIAIRFFSVDPYGAQLIGMVLYTAVSYVGCKKLVFSRASHGN